MFCKLFLVVVFLHTTAIYANQLKEIQQLYSAIGAFSNQNVRNFDVINQHGWTKTR